MIRGGICALIGIMASLKTHTIRLKPNTEIRKAIEEFASKNNIKAGCVLTCVGCLIQVSLRMAGAKQIKDYNDNYEIVSLVGTLEPGNCHLHISLSDENGSMIGGHLKSGIIGTTVEIVIGELEGIKFTREMDSETGYEELVVV